MKVYIIGGPGGGKSTMANTIAERTGAQVFDLDNYFWKTGGLKSANELRVEMANIMAHESWIAEGVYSESAGDLIEHSEVVLWIEVPLAVSIWRIVARHVRRSISGRNEHPGIWRLIKFLWWTVKYHLADRPPDALPGRAERRRHTKAYLETYREKVIGPRAGDVRAWSQHDVGTHRHR